MDSGVYERYVALIDNDSEDSRLHESLVLAGMSYGSLHHQLSTLAGLLRPPDFIRA